METVTIEGLQQENALLKEEIETLKQKLQKYTNSTGHKRYYERNKALVKAKARSYMDKLKVENPEKLKEYRRRAYLKRKEKLKREKEMKELDEINEI